MLKRAYSASRRYLGILRTAAIIAGFLLVLHSTHRECAKNTDRPAKLVQAPATKAGAAAEKQKVVADKKPKKVRSGKIEVFQATAYSLSGLTRTGIPTAPGVVAADPRVIPLGSIIHVDSPTVKGVFQVMDTGDLIKGKIIDIFMPSYEACKDFGRRVVKVKVLRYGFHGKTASERKAEP